MKATIRINHSDNHLLWLIVCLNKRLATEFHESQMYCKKRILLAAKTDDKKGQMKPKKKILIRTSTYQMLVQMNSL